MEESILEFIAQQRGCFISSLPDLTHEADFFSFLRQIPVEQYPPEEWEYGLSYVFRGKLLIENYQQVEAFLQQQEATFHNGG